MAATMTNGKPQRKQLSDQLDRMDGIIDCLADALPEAVADAVKDGARQAIREAVLEALANPDLRALVARPVADPAPPRPSAWTRLKWKLSTLRQRATEQARPLVEATVEACRSAVPAADACRRVVVTAWGLKKPVALAVGVGLAIGIGCYLAPHAVAAAASGIGGTVAVAAVQGGLWVRATARQLGLLNQPVQST